MHLLKKRLLKEIKNINWCLDFFPVKWIHHIDIHSIGDKMDAHNLLAKQIIHKQQYQEENLISRIVESDKNRFKMPLKKK